MSVDHSTELGLALYGVSEAAHTLAFDLDGARDRDLALALARALGRTRVSARKLDLASVQNDAHAVRPVVAAQTVLSWVTRWVPPGDRARYREEFDAELEQLVGMSWWAQLAYAAGIGLGGFSLRRALREPPPASGPAAGSSSGRPR